MSGKTCVDTKFLFRKKRDPWRKIPSGCQERFLASCFRFGRQRVDSVKEEIEEPFTSVPPCLRTLSRTQMTACDRITCLIFVG